MKPVSHEQIQYIVCFSKPRVPSSNAVVGTLELLVNEKGNWR